MAEFNHYFLKFNIKEVGTVQMDGTEDEARNKTFDILNEEFGPTGWSLEEWRVATEEEVEVFKQLETIEKNLELFERSDNETLN